MPRYLENLTSADLAAIQMLESLYDSKGSPSRVYATALHKRLERDWAKTNGAKPANGAVCVQRLLGKRCGFTRGKSCACTPPGSDHSSVWMKDGKAHYYVSQPYGMSMQALDELSGFCKRYGLQFHVDSSPAFYFPTSVLFVVIERAG